MFVKWTILFVGLVELLFLEQVSCCYDHYEDRQG